MPFDEVVAHLGEHRLRAAGSGRDGRRILGARRNPGRLLAGIAQAGAPRVLGRLVESIRRFDVETQRSVLKVEHCTLLPMLECPRPRGLWPPARVAGREAVPGEEGNLPGLGVSGAAGRAARGNAGGVDGQARGAVGRAVAAWRGRRRSCGNAWIGMPTRPFARPSGSSFAGRNWKSNSHRRRRSASPTWRWATRSRDADFHAAVDGVSRQHAGGGGRGPQASSSAAGARSSSRRPGANWSGWRTSSRNTRSPFNSGLSPPGAARPALWRNARTWPGPPPAPSW